MPQYNDIILKIRDTRAYIIKNAIKWFSVLVIYFR